MQLKTMAMQISNDNWSVAVAILGSSFASIPQPEILGGYVVINSFDTHRPRSRGRMAYGTNSFASDLILGNTWFTADEFNAMYNYDKRRKNLDSFFEVDKVAEMPRRTVEDPVYAKARELAETYMGENNDD